MDGVPYPMWIGYLKLVWAKLERKPRSVLEVCCGTGKLCRLLAEEGYDMVGVDLSRDMIRIAKKEAAAEEKTIRFEAQDAAEMKLAQTFDDAFSFFDSLNYITDPNRCAMAIKKTGQHLNPGGSFLFDLNTAYAFEQKMFDQQEMKASAKVKYKWRSEWQPQKQLCTVRMDFWHDGRHYEEVHVQRAHSREEVDQWMREAGFESVQFFDAYTLDPPRGRSDRIHVLGVMAES